MIQSVQMLSDTGTTWNVDGTPVKGAGFFGKVPGVHTLAFMVQKFVGRFYILATLENTVQEADANNGWFPIYIDQETPNAYLEFPLTKDANKPSIGLYGYQSTASFCQTFVGNFTFIKVQVKRDYLKDSSTQTISVSDQDSVGKVQFAMINF